MSWRLRGACSLTRTLISSCAVSCASACTTTASVTPSCPTCSIAARRCPSARRSRRCWPVRSLIGRVFGGTSLILRSRTNPDAITLATFPTEPSLPEVTREYPPTHVRPHRRRTRRDPGDRAAAGHLGGPGDQPPDRRELCADVRREARRARPPLHEDHRRGRAHRPHPEPADARQAVGGAHVEGGSRHREPRDALPLAPCPRARRRVRHRD